MARARRYSIERTARGCTLTLAPGYGGVEGEGSVHHFWCHPENPGYAYEERDGRPATLGRQVCDELFGHGSTLFVSTRERLVSEIRSRARRHCDAIDREEASR